MKFLNFLFAILLVTAFTSCDASKKVSSATPSTTAAPSTADARKAASTKLTKPAIEASDLAESKAAAVERAAAAKAKASTSKVAKMEQPKMGEKIGSKVKPGSTKVPTSKPSTSDVSLAKTGDVMNTPGKITWEAANERYSAAGTFTRWRMTDVKMMGDDLNTLTAKLEIDLTSISEKSPKLTDHLKADDYFGVEEHQLATIEVTEVMKGKDVSTAKMTLKMRGQEQELTGTFRVANLKPLRIVGETTMDRSIFGIGTANTSVPNEIKVKFDTVIPR